MKKTINKKPIYAFLFFSNTNKLYYIFYDT